MASGAKRKTTMAKRDRENAVRERRARKQAKRDAKRHPSEPPSASNGSGPEAGSPD